MLPYSIRNKSTCVRAYVFHIKALSSLFFVCKNLPKTRNPFKNKALHFIAFRFPSWNFPMILSSLCWWSLMCCTCHVACDVMNVCAILTVLFRGFQPRTGNSLVCGYFNVCRRIGLWPICKQTMFQWVLVNPTQWSYIFFLWEKN